MSKNHYIHVRYVGLEGRIAREVECPLRLASGKPAVKRKGMILPVLGVDAEGFALVDIASKKPLGHTPKTAEGWWDYDALAAQFPEVQNPHAVLAGVRTVGPVTATKAKVVTKAKPKASTAKAKAAPRTKPASPAGPAEMSIAYLKTLADTLAKMTPEQNAALVKLMTKK